VILVLWWLRTCQPRFATPANPFSAKEPMIDHSITLKYNPHHRTNIGRKATPAVRVYRSDPEGITLQIWHEHEYMSAWLSFADALALADLICKAANEGAAQ
jgi:hypothetical protein